MSPKALFAILIGAAGLTLACLCGSTRILPLWTPAPGLASKEVASVPTPVASQDSQTGAVCLRDLSQALADSENINVAGTELETDYTLVTYTVSGDSLVDPVKVTPIPPDLAVYQDDIAGQLKLWNFFVDIIPADQRTEVTRFSVFTDGPNNSLGAVEQTDDPRYWKLEMDIEDGQNFANLSSTLVHEFAHLLTLNEAQVPPDLQVFDHPDDQVIYDQSAANCPTYFTFEGCSRPESYLNRFFQSFWTGLYGQWSAINAETDPDKLDEKLNRFYRQHEDQFVSTYAVTSPEEDIAESFMYFIFEAAPAGQTVADQKVLFFYGFPELVTLRERILSRLCKYVLTP